MIHPDEIKRKAEKLYPKAIQAWLQDDKNFFPHRLRCDLSHPKSHSDLVRETELLKSFAKEKVGWGYRLESESTKSRSHGHNDFLSGVYIDSLEDLLQMVGKQTEFRKLAGAVSKLRNAFPNLLNWMIDHWEELIKAHDSIDHLIQVTKHLCQSPRPNCFARELPLAVPTKLIENNRKLLGQWFDQLLPTESIDFGCNPRDFNRRYGFRQAREHLMMRVLDSSLRSELGIPFDECSLPPQTIASLAPREAIVIIVENKVNLLTLPPLPRTLAFGGMGMGVTQLFEVEWLERTPLYYWGDVDVQGFEILAVLRRRFAHTRSLWMSAAVLSQFRSLTIEGTGRIIATPSELNAEEAEAFHLCRDENLRFEQEHIPQSIVDEILKQQWTQPSIRIEATE